jgi:hypothetical protein
MNACVSEVLGWCYGDGGKGIEEWRRLRGYIEKWVSRRPESFNPFRYQNLRGSGSFFPRVEFLNDCHSK